MNDDARLREFLDQEAARRRRGAIVTLVVGLIVAAIIAGYMGWVSAQLFPLLDSFDQYLEPRGLVDFAYVQYVDPQVDVLIDGVKGLVEENVPVAFEEGKKYLEKKAPELRDELQKRSLEQLNNVVGYVSEALSEHAADLIAEHKPNIDALLADFDNPDRQDEMRRTLKAAFEEVAEKDLDAHLPGWMADIREVREKLQVLAEAEGLTEEQQLMRELVILARECRDRFFPKELPKLELFLKE